MICIFVEDKSGKEGNTKVNSHYLVPETKVKNHSCYDIYPSFPLMEDKINVG